MTDTTQEKLRYAGLLDRLREHVGFNSDGVGSTDTAHCRPASKRYDSLRLEAADAIATLKAENARLKEELSQFWFQERTTEQRGEEYAAWKRQCTVAMLTSQSQAAAMAGLLEEVSEDLESAGHWGGSTYAEKCRLCQLAARIDAALATWKGNTK